MKKQISACATKVALPIAISAAALLLNAGSAKAGATAQPSGLSLPAAYSWSAGTGTQPGATPASAAAALQSLVYAQAHSTLYNPSWFYDLEIFSNENLTPPSGGSATASQGSAAPVTEVTPDGTLGAPVDPVQSLALAQADSPSYSSSWVTDTNLFLDRNAPDAGTDPTDVPEPGTLPVLGTGLVGLAMILLKKRRGSKSV